MAAINKNHLLAALIVILSREEEHITNDEVLSRAKEKRSIIARITKQQKLWIGHNLRHPDNFLTLPIEGRFIGKRG